MAKSKYKWEVEPKPSGGYSSFQARSWPSMKTNDDNGYLLASIFHVDGNDYTASSPKNSGLRLKVRVYNYSDGIAKRKSSVSKDLFETIRDAKEWAKTFFKHHKDWVPRSEEVK